MRGKQWSVEEERRLRELISEGSGIAKISTVMGKTRVSVRAKMYHLGLVLVDATTAVPPTVASLASIASVASTPQPIADQFCNSPPSDRSTNNPAPATVFPPASDSINVDLITAQLKREGPLPSIEEKLRVLDGALVALEKPGLSFAEVTRLSKIIQGVKVYQDLFAQFVNYQTLENEVVELRKQLASEREQK